MTTPDRAEPDVDHTQVLLARLSQGDRRALGEILARDLEWVRARVHDELGGSVRNEGDTNDFVQDVLVKVLTAGLRFPPADQAQLRAFLATSVTNHLRSVGRRTRTAKRDDRRTVALPTDTALGAGENRAVDSVSRPDAKAGAAEMRDLVGLAIRTLDPVEQTVLRLRSEDREFTEIGNTIGKSEDAARMIFNRALPKLDQAIQRLRRGGSA